MMEVLYVLYLNLKIHILIMTALHTNFVILTFCKEPSGSHASTWLRNRRIHGYKLIISASVSSPLWSRPWTSHPFASPAWNHNKSST